MWFAEAGKYFGIPLDDRNAIAILTTPRPSIAKPRDRYTYYPNTLEVPKAVAVNIRGRSFKIAAELDIQTPEASGALFAHGGMFDGHALYFRHGRLKYVYNYLGMAEQMVVSDRDVPSGTCVLGVEFTKLSRTPQATVGALSLFINDQQVGQLSNVKTQNGKFSLCGEGLNIGRDGGAPVTEDYPGERPWGLVGGTIQRVVVDVSGEAYLDLENEAIGMMSRE